MPRYSYKTVGELVNQAEEEANEEEIDADSEQFDSGTAADFFQSRQDRHASVIQEITDLIGSKDAAQQAREEETKRNTSGVWGALHGVRARDQIMSPWFVLITLFTVIQMTRINYFVATIRSQYMYLLGSVDKAVEVNEFFDIALPLGGVIAIPFIGIILDRTSTAFVLSMLVFFATLIGVFGMIPHMWAAYANVSLFVIYRPFYYTCVS
jgi:hypothetical protein